MCSWLINCADKEHWEPTIEGLFRREACHSHREIREVWAIDWPNHGDSAALNTELFKQPNSNPREHKMHILSLTLAHPLA